MKTKYAYPAVFTYDGEFYNVNFPDLEGCYTQGDSIEDALVIAADILCLTLYNLEESKESIPAPSDIKNIHTADNEFVSFVSCDTVEYRKLYDNKAVKKTLTIPSWLNTISEKASINFSAVLANALKKELNID